MRPSRSVLILGASYGSLLGMKLALAGHRVRLICLPEEAALINEQGAVVRLPVRGPERQVELNSKNARGELTAGGPGDSEPADFDLVALAMQEPQYRVAEVRQLLGRVATAGIPCMSIMNMPPLTYLRRIPGLDAERVRRAYADAAVWDQLDPKRITLCSPDPQAFRPPGEPVNVLQVGLPTNFKAAPFETDADTSILRALETDIDDIRFDAGNGPIELPVKLRVHDSIFVPLAKWSMLLAGNYRCVGRDDTRSIREAVHGDVDAARVVYEWVADLCVALGADRGDLVPFEKYARAAESLGKPSSVARALAAGAPNVERVDRLVQSLAAQHGMRSPAVDEIVEVVDYRVESNRRKT